MNKEEIKKAGGRKRVTLDWSTLFYIPLLVEVAYIKHGLSVALLSLTQDVCVEEPLCGEGGPVQHPL